MTFGCPFIHSTDISPLYEILDKPYGFCCPVAYGKEGVISERNHKLTSLRKLLFSSGENKDLLRRRWNLSTAVGNRLDLQMCSLMALGRRNDSMNKPQK